MAELEMDKTILDKLKKKRRKEAWLLQMTP